MDDLLIATWQEVFVRYRDGSIRSLRTAGKPFYGLTWNASALFVGCRGWDTRGHETLAIYDRQFNLLEVQEIPTDGQLHQILWLPQRRCLALTDTLHDRIIFWEPVRREVLYTLDVGHGDNEHHVNSLWVDGNDNLLVTGLHGETWAEVDGWLYKRLTYDFEIHNIMVKDGVVYLGASDQEALYVEGRGLVSLRGAVGVLHDPTDLRQCYTRGLACSQDRIYVGAAAVQDERSERAQGNSAVVLLDMDLKPVEVLRFEGGGGMHDIRILGPVDYGHNGVAW